MGGDDAPFVCVVGDVVGATPEVPDEENLLLMLVIQDARRTPPPLSFSELLRFRRLGRLDAAFALVVDGEGVLGWAAVVSLSGSRGVVGVTAPGKYESRSFW
jgi:hypothetical protein